AGSSGIVAIIWAAVCPRRMQGRSSDGRRSSGTSRKSNDTASPETCCAAGVSARHCCTGPMTAARFEETDASGRAMRRREVIMFLAGTAAAWPLASRAQQPDRVRLIGVLMNRAADDVEGQAGVTAFGQALRQIGWIEGRNVRLEIRWGAND